MKKIKRITWSSKLVDVKAVKPTPNNYKIKTDLGKERLHQSLKAFGLAGNAVVNTDMVLIDGNSRLIEAKERGEKKMWVSVPSRKLTPKEFSEMSKIFDFAKAGEVDVERIKQETHVKEFFDKWSIAVPQHLLDTLGSKQQATRVKSGKVEYAKEEKVVVDEYQVTLFFTEKEEKLFRKLEDKFRLKFKTVNTSETVLKALKSIK